VQRLSEICSVIVDVVGPGRAPVYVPQVEDKGQLSVEGPNPLGAYVHQVVCTARQARQTVRLASMIELGAIREAVGSKDTSR
jgi:hypothetical protein